MPVFLSFLLYLAACLGFSIVLVPEIQPWLFDSVGLPPESSLYRFAMLLALVGMPFLLRLLRLDNRTAAGFGLQRRAAGLALGKGLLTGIAIMAAVTMTLWWLDIRQLSPQADTWNPGALIRTLLGGLIAGIVVGLIEETFFRGLLHTGMRRSLGFWPTATLTALLYASLHFMKPEPPAGDVFSSTTALASVLTGLGRIGDFGPISDSFVTLLVAGVFLSMVRERTGNILWAIGIHAGWVMIIKLVKHLTNTAYVDGQASVWVGSYDHVTGWMATLWLGVIAAVYWVYTRSRG